MWKIIRITGDAQYDVDGPFDCKNTAMAKLRYYQFFAKKLGTYKLIKVTNPHSKLIWTL